MSKRDLFHLPKLRGPADADTAPEVSTPLGGSRAEANQRLQVGLSGIAAMILLVGLANIIQDRARVTERASVPDAAPTTAPVEAPPQRDPLADAGVVPDLPIETVPAPEINPLADTEQEDVEDAVQP